MSKLLEMFQQDFMINVLLGTGIVAVVCAYLSVFIVLRRAVFLGAALAQVSSLGVALALLVAGLGGAAVHGHNPVWALPFALVLTVAAAIAMALQQRERRVPRDTFIGVTYAGAGALAVLAVALSVGGEAQVMNLLFGNVLTISTSTVVGLGVLALLVGLLHGCFFKEFLLVSFDPDMAAALGYRARLWDVSMFSSIAVTIALAIRAAGALVVFSYLVVPAATALVMGRSLRAVAILAVLVSLVSTVAGISASYVYDLPTGPCIITANLLLWLLAQLARFRR